MVLAAPAAQAQSGTPGRDQYIPSEPSATGQSKDKNRSANQSSTGSGSADDQALDRITGGGSSNGSSSKGDKKDDGSGSKDETSSDDGSGGSSDASRAIPPVGAGGDDDDGDGALSSVSGTLTDWDEPLVPGLVALVALFTLATSIVVLVRRRRSPGRGA
jgi:hypothetical protein